jgi:hypothetical protein
MPRRFEPGYDVSTIRSTISLINYVDLTDKDYLDFGIQIVSNFFSWLAGVHKNYNGQDEENG